MTQRELAAAAGVHRATIKRIEAGQRPSPKTANAIGYVLRVDRDVLFGETTPNRRPSKASPES